MKNRADKLHKHK